MPKIGSARTETVTLYFPDIVPFQYDYSEEIASVDLITDAWGAEQRMSVVAGRVAMRGSIYALTLAERSQIRDFIVDSAKMRLYPFYVFGGVAEQYGDFQFGVGDNVEDTFDLPFKGGYAGAADAVATVTDLKGNGIPIGFGYTVSYYAGRETYITFTAPPTAGMVLTADIVGRPRYPVRLADASQAIKFLPTADNRGLREVAVVEIL